MLRILIDTCVWLDMAKDYRQKPMLAALEQLVRMDEVSLVVPQIVVDEIARNKTRLVEESGRSLSSVFKRVKEAVEQFGDDTRKVETLAQLNDVDHRIGTLGEAVNDSIARIEKLLAVADIFETSDAMKLRAADRALSGRAPFHRKKNSIDDAILIETYADALTEDIPDCAYAFVTHNVHDFSHVAVDNRKPHPDIAAHFDGDRSTYSTSLGDLMKALVPEWLEDARFEFEFHEEPRQLSEILAAIEECFDKIWYNRHLGLRNGVESGKIKVVESYDFKPGKSYPRNIVVRDIWEGAQKAARRVEAQYPGDLGPWTTFDWGMLNGKMSALRWVLGDDWDMLDT